MLKPSIKTPATREAEQQQVTTLLAELATQISRFTPGEGAFSTAVPRLTFGKVTRIIHPIRTVYEPALCVIANGMKKVLLGEEVYQYDSDSRRYLVFAHNLPVTGQVADASPESPHLALRLDFDLKEIAALVVELKLAGKPVNEAPRGVYTGELSPALLEPLVRLARLLESPEDIPTLAPLVTREVLYRLLRSPEGWRLVQIALVDSQSQRIARVIEFLRNRFRESLRMEEVAKEANWSVSALHHHFKSVTAMSPLQFQKQLRLQEARRIMLGESVDAAIAGYRVGYDSQSQFNREYSRFFGAPPVRDIKRLRELQRGT